MQECFNTTGLCYPDEHYMVNIEGRLEEIKVLIDKGEYFAINRARQYGKTTTLHLLTERLSEDYAVLSLSFEGMEDEVYESVNSFCQRFCRLLYKHLLRNTVSAVPDYFKDELRRMFSGKIDMEDLSDIISKFW